MDTNLTLTRPSPKLFVCNLPDSGRHVTKPNQGLSTGRRENLGTRLDRQVFKSADRKNATIIRWPSRRVIALQVVRTSFLGPRPRLFPPPSPPLVKTMFTYSHANTPLGQSERAYYLGYFINASVTDLLRT